MEFNNIRKADLLLFAQSNNLDVTEESTVKEIDEALTDAAFTREDYDAFVNESHDEEPEDETPAEQVISDAPNNEEVVGTASVETESEQVLVKMDRGNMSYLSGSHTFTRNHPFAVMDKKEAEEFVSKRDGFHIASASEAERFYA